MDQNTCLEMIVNAINDEEWVTAAECADNLESWLRKDGFMPTVRAAELRVLCVAIARLAAPDA